MSLSKFIKLPDVKAKLKQEFATFTEDEIDGAIKFYSYAHGGGYDLQRFGKLFQEKINLLTAQLFSALGKGVYGNEIPIEVNDGNLTSHITIKTVPHADLN